MATDTAVRRCESCGEPLPALARPNRRYCSGRCRTTAYAARRRGERVAAVERLASLDELERALETALAEPRLVARVAAAAKENWRAAVWILERRYPERWGASRAVGGPPPPALDDPFLEVDQLAELRRRKLGVPSDRER